MPLGGGAPEELDVGEQIVEYLKSKSLLAAANSLQESLKDVADKSPAEQDAMNLFVSGLERKLGITCPESSSKGAAAPLDMTPAPERGPKKTDRNDQIPASPMGSSNSFKRATRGRAKLINMIPCSSELEAAGLRQQHGSSDPMSRVLFHTPPSREESTGEQAIVALPLL